jgi:hypothetical protein
LERVKGIEPSSQPWEGHILPLNHTRNKEMLTNCRCAGNWFAAFMVYEKLLKKLLHACVFNLLVAHNRHYRG